MHHAQLDLLGGIYFFCHLDELPPKVALATVAENAEV